MSEAPYPPADEPVDAEWADAGPPSGPGRYSASASVPKPPSSPAGQAPGAPQSPGAPQGYPPPPAYDPYQSPQEGGSGRARVAASASVPVPPASPPPQQPQSPPAPGTYGNPVAPPVNSPWATPNPPGASSLPPPPSVPGGGYPSPPTGTYGAPTGTYGQPSGAYGQPAPTPPARSESPGRSEQQARPEQQGQPWGEPTRQDPGRADLPRLDQPVMPTGGWPYVSQPTGQVTGQKSKRGLIITLLAIGAVILIGGAVAIGYFVMHQDDPYVVGACVQQDGDKAKIVTCGSSGAFTITARVSNVNDCPDPAQPAIVVDSTGSSEVACLKPSTG